MEVNARVAVPVSEASQVSDARRQAALISTKIGFSEERTGAVALAVTEAATNLVKHGRGGFIVIQTTSAEGVRGVELFSLDKGPGIPNIAASLRDGHSTAGSPGLGLGALSRLSGNLDIYSQAGHGTAMHWVIWPDTAPRAYRDLEVGAVSVPVKGENVCGDDWSLHAHRGRYVLLVVDGLGHGPEAAAAAMAALDVVSREPQRTSAEHIHAVHGALRSTRGAAGAVIEVRPDTGVGTFCGVGNIGCFVRSEGKTRSLASHNGILGHQMRKVQEFSFPFPHRALLYAYSDGMTSRWDPASYPGLESRGAALIAGVLYRDHNRGRDDTTLVVMRNTRESA